VKKKINTSKSDIKDWEEYIKNPKDIFDKDKSLKKSIKELTRFKFDLHGYKLTDANETVREILLSCWEKKYNEILLITGKGIHSKTENDVYISEDLSKLRYSIPEYINSNEELFKKVKKIYTANEQDGGSGAIIIKLKFTK
tara:strand:+ start:427 stop:849 length:423 start_codon:yes stop_codon:yes gene_type:complete